MLQKNSIIPSYFLVGSLDEFFFSKKQKKNFDFSQKKINIKSKNTVFLPKKKESLNKINFIFLYTQVESKFNVFSKKHTPSNFSFVQSFLKQFLIIYKFNSVSGNVKNNCNISSYKVNFILQQVFFIQYGLPFSFLYGFNKEFNNSFTIYTAPCFEFINNEKKLNTIRFNSIRNTLQFNRFHKLFYYNYNDYGVLPVYFNVLSLKKNGIKKDSASFFKNVLRSFKFKRLWTRFIWKTYRQNRNVNVKRNIHNNPETLKVSLVNLYSKIKNKVSTNVGFKFPFEYSQNQFFSNIYFQKKKFKKRKSKKVSKVYNTKFTSQPQLYYTNTTKSNIVKVFPETFTRQLFNKTKGANNAVFSDFNQLKKLLSVLTNNRFSLYYVNVLSLTRFAFDNEIAEKKKIARTNTSYQHLSSLERERNSRYRYVAIYIQDLIRVSFFSFYLKKASFLVSFFAFTLSKLPRNRKETQFLRFIIKLVKVFASQRKEILGVRIRFQGRVNRWRRTKYIKGEHGFIAFYTYSSRIDFGRTQSITRKGTLGIRLWICYKASFVKKLRSSIFHYVQLPKRVFVK